MRDKIIAFVIFALVIGFITANTVIIDNVMTNMIEEVSALDFENDGSKIQAEAIWEDFKKKETYISMTVSHDGMSNIEDCFCEMIGALGTGDTDGADTAKYRLINSLEHLRRLSGVNIDAII